MPWWELHLIHCTGQILATPHAGRIEFWQQCCQNNNSVINTDTNKQLLANKIWASANKMRSKIDANEYKDYILGLIFYKFLSDNGVAHLKRCGWTDEYLPELVEDYENTDSVTIIEDCKSSIGYFIEYKNPFSTWLLPDTTFSVADLSVALNRFDCKSDL